LCLFATEGPQGHLNCRQ